MIKTLLAVCVLGIATFIAPVWLQIVLYVLGVFFIPTRMALLIPAVFADALYAPEFSWALSNHRYVLLVAGMIVVYWIVRYKTRIGEMYGMAN